MRGEILLFAGVALVKIAIVLGIFFVFGALRFSWSDSTTYLQLANDIGGCRGYSDLIRTPLYPFLIVLLGQSVLAIVLVQALFAAASVVVVRRIALFFMDGRRAILVALLFAFEPMGVLLNVLVLPETVLVFFLLLFLYSFLLYLQHGSGRYLVFAALTLTLVVWTKPVAIYLYLVPLGFIIFYKRQFARAAFFIILIFGFLAPWTYYNRTRLGTQGLTAHDTQSVCGYLLISVYAAEYGTDPSNMDVNLFPKSFLDARARCTSAAAGFKIAAFEHPRAFIKTMVLSTVSLLTNEGYGAILQKAPDESIKAHHNYLNPVVFADAAWREKLPAAIRELGFKKAIAIGIGKLFWFAVVCLALWAVILLTRARGTRVYALFLLFVMVYFIAVTVASTGFGVGARLRYPIDALLLLFAVVALQLRIRRT